MSSFGRLLRAFPAILFLISATPSQLPASGLAVQPGTFLFRDIPIGEKVRLSVPLSVHNKDSTPHTYVIAPLLPSSIGMAWPEGYTEIPVTNWFSFEKREITIAGAGTGSTTMYIEIPGVDAYYNQKWVIGLGVTTKVESGESISLAVYPRFLIETESREEIQGRPAGKTGIKPGKSHLTRPFKESLYIYNNDNVSHTYKIYPAIPSEGRQSQILPTPSYEWIPSAEWIAVTRDEIAIEAGGIGEVYIHLEMPQSSAGGLQRWEVLLNVKPDNGPSTFGRILITP